MVICGLTPRANGEHEMITVPVVGSEISVADFGAPVANALNPGPWNAITVFLNGWSNLDGPAPAGRYLRWRREGPLVRWTGCLGTPGGGLVTSSSIVCAVPAAAKPDGSPCFVGSAGNGVCGLEFIQGANLSVAPLAGSPGVYLFADMILYPYFSW